MKKIYLVKNLTPWIVSELLAFAQFVEFRLVLLRQPSEIFKDDLDRLNNAGIEIYVRPFNIFPNFCRSVFALSFMLKEILRFAGLRNFIFGIKSIYWFTRLNKRIIINKDSINAHFATQASLIALLYKEYYKDCEFFFTFHAYDIYFRNKWFELLVKESNKTFSISNYAKEYVRNKYKIEETEKLVVSRLGIFHLPNNYNNRIKDKESLKIGFLGRLVKEKNIFLLLDIIKTLSISYSSIILFLAGEGYLYSPIKKYIEDHKLNKIIFLRGFLYKEEKIKFLKEVDVLILPSVSEGMPIVLMEAFEFGIPVITSDIAGIPEICKDKFNGFLIPPNNKEALLHAILKFYYMDSYTFTQYKINAYKSRKEYDIVLNSKRKLEIMKWL